MTAAEHVAGQLDLTDQPVIDLGGPDPFPDERAGDCPHQAHNYWCTRDAGHDGLHVAMAHVVVAIWPPFEELSIEADTRGGAA